jgi:hypothetical protein
MNAVARLTLLWLALLILSACQVTPPEPAPDEPLAWRPDPAAESRYRVLVEQAQRNPRAVDFRELREVYTRTRWYQPYGGPEHSFGQRAFEALEAGRFARALEFADRILEHNFVSLNAHYVAREACQAQGMEDEAAWHDYTLRGLFESIRASGDGMAPESAFWVVSTSEIKAFLELYNLELIEDEFMVTELGPFDRMDVRQRDTGERFRLYFDIRAQWERGFHGI